MSIRPSFVVLAGVLLATGAMGACRQQPAGLVAERLDATLIILPDGSLQVEEQWSVRVEGDAARFRRYTPAERHDGVVSVQGAMDGKLSEAGSASDQFSVGPGPALDAQWTLTSQAGARHTFLLRYQLKGAVAVSGIRGEVSTPLLVPRDFGIESASIVLKLPPGAVLLQDPWINEADWDVERRPDGLTASRRNIGRDESATPGATFTIDTMTAGEPSWQYFDRRSRDLMPAFVSGGLFLLVIGAGVIGMLRMKFQPWPVRQAEGETFALDPELGRAILKEKYNASLLSRLVSAGLVDSERMQVARDLRRAAVATLIFGTACWIVTSFAFAHLGPWPLAIPIGILGSGAMFAIAGRRFSILSQTGVDARRRMLYSARIRGGPTSA